MIINDNSVEQINVALLDLQKKIEKVGNNGDASLGDAIISAVASLSPGKTYDINITGNAATATTANTAGYASEAGNVDHAITATSAEQLAHPRTITLSGDATGSASFDGSTNVEINTDVTHADNADKWTQPITVRLTGDAIATATIDGSEDIDIDVYVPGGGGGGGIVEVTQAEYDALTQEEKEDGRVRVISDSDEAQILAETVFGLVHPIGEVYVQYPNQKTPNELWGQFSTWTEITSDYAGLFFRAEGGNSAAFGTNQAEGLPNLTGDLVSNNTYSGTPYSTGGPSGVFRAKSISGTQYYLNGRATGNGWVDISFDASRGSTDAVYGKSAHVTPVNTAIKLWKRTA